MSEEILVNITPMETRVAVVENGATQDVHIERSASRGIVGTDTGFPIEPQGGYGEEGPLLIEVPGHGNTEAKLIDLIPWPVR